MNKVIMEAWREIEPIIRKHDLGAYINLEDKGLGEFQFWLPSWSVASIHDNGIQFKIKKENQADAEATIGMLFSMRNRAATQFQACDYMIKALQEKLEIDHDEIDMNKIGETH